MYTNVRMCDMIITDYLCYIRYFTYQYYYQLARRKRVSFEPSVLYL